jgi:hypothetical protein
MSVNVMDTWGMDSMARSGALDSQLIGGLTRAGGFRIVVNPSREDVSLVLLHPLDDQASAPGEPIALSVPIDTFAHSQSDALITLFAVRADGRPLPRWLRFDAANGKFYGVPPDGFDGDIDVKVIARDNFGNDVSTSFRFRIHSQREAVAFRGKEGLSSVLKAQASVRLPVGRDTPPAALHPLARQRAAGRAP